MKHLLILLVGYLPLLSHALVPVEGLLLGQAKNEYQQDPLRYIFSDIYDQSVVGENRKLKLYKHTYDSGIALSESCSLFSAPVYASSWMDRQAKRMTASTLQYIGLDTTIKAIGAYGKSLGLSEEDYGRLADNLVKNYCSKNLTILSLKTVRKSLDYYYQNPMENFLPSISTSPYATEAMKQKSGTPEARSNEFDYAIRSFRSFCSWGGEVSDYRMLTAYLKNPFIMAFLIKNMVGIQDKFDETTQRVKGAPSTDTVQVTCSDHICRKSSVGELKKELPSTVGSTGMSTDLAKLYCHHFRYQDYSTKDAVPQVKEWIKNQELEDPIFEVSFFVSLMTGVPEIMLGTGSYNDVPFIAKSSIDERWTKWSKQVLNSFSKDLLFEESLRIKAEPRRDKVAIRTEGFKVDVSVTLGEMDRLTDANDKLLTQFELKLTKNYLRQVRNKWDELTKDVDFEGMENFKREIAQYLNLQLKDKEKLLRQKMWNDDFSQILANELLQQAILYRGPLFDSYEEQVLKVPVRFSYGVFALGYLRYRMDVNSGRLKLNL